MNAPGSNNLITFLRLGDYGRLGNQLFQIAATLGLAYRTGKRPVFPEWEFAPWIDVPLAPVSELSSIAWTTRHPASFRYDPLLAEGVSGNLNLEGYLQSERYFDEIQQVVRAAIMSAKMKALSEKVAKLHGIGINNDWCAVHVRRGDYLKFSDLYAQLTPSGYYLPAMQAMIASGIRRFMIVSDDPGWCRGFLNGPGISFSRNVGTIKDRVLNSQRHRELAASASPRWAATLNRYAATRVLSDLLLMSACRHHIIANSSFSWWSSWLSDFPDREVVAPRSWFTEQLPHDTTDLYRREMRVM